MRPAGEVRQALYQAASAIYTAGQGATLAELTATACVGRDAARRCVDNMKRSGALQIVGQRRVDYRNRPVAEYAPANLCEPTAGEGWVDLGLCMADWAR